MAPFAALHAPCVFAGHPHPRLPFSTARPPPLTESLRDAVFSAPLQNNNPTRVTDNARTNESEFICTGFQLFRSSDRIPTLLLNESLELACSQTASAIAVLPQPESF